MKKLFIANKNYSSWSLRAWLLMQELNIEFEEIIAPLVAGQYWQDYRKFSPNGKVPCLVDDNHTIWDSLAIMEYLAEDNSQVWPLEKSARTWSRSASAEMHSGFPAIRNQCAMNCGLRIKLHQLDEALLHDVNRIDELWQQGLSDYGGPFLAGKCFTAVDAMYAPIAFRNQTFRLPFSQKSQDYMDLILSLSSMQDWYTAALMETWREDDHEQEAQNAGKLIKDLRKNS
jgi:glutathione S-transferase